MSLPVNYYFLILLQINFVLISLAFEFDNFANFEKISTEKLVWKINQFFNFYEFWIRKFCKLEIISNVTTELRIKIFLFHWNSNLKISQISFKFILNGFIDPSLVFVLLFGKSGWNYQREIIKKILNSKSIVDSSSRRTSRRDIFEMIFIKLSFDLQTCLV